MPRRRDADLASVDPRRLVAEAARRLVEGRDRDPVSALYEAARALGLRDRGHLPPVAAIVDAARAERRLFGGATHADRLSALRRSALEAMHFLAAFEPRLVGGVLDGWAGEGAAVELQIFTDDHEGLLLRLGEIGIRPRVHAPGAPVGDEARPAERLAFLAGGVPVELTVFHANDLRRRTVARGLGRATRAEVERLLRGP